MFLTEGKAKLQFKVGENKDVGFPTPAHVHTPS